MLSSRQSHEELKTLGRYSLIGLVILIFVFLVATRVFNQSFLVQNFLNFMTGDFTQVKLDLLGYIHTILALSLIMLGINFIFARFAINTEQFKKDISEKTIVDYFREIGPFGLYISILIEEVLARFIFLGLLANWLNTGVVGTLILFAIGNIAWALLHLTNYKEGHRKLRYAVPAFLAGIFLGYIFIVYGFWVALLVHIVYDVIAVSSHKTQKFGKKNIAVGFYWLLVLILAVVYASGQNIDFSVLLTIFNGEIVNISPLVFGLALLIISAGGDVLSTLLALDVINENPKVAEYPLFKKLAYIFFEVVISVLIFYLIVWIFGFIANPTTGLLVSVAVIFLLRFPKSGSAIAKSWLVGIPATFVLVLAVTTLPFISTLTVLFVVCLFDIPAYIIAKNFQPSDTIFSLEE